MHDLNQFVQTLGKTRPVLKDRLRLVAVQTFGEVEPSWTISHKSIGCGPDSPAYDYFLACWMVENSIIPAVRGVRLNAGLVWKVEWESDKMIEGQVIN